MFVIATIKRFSFLFAALRRLYDTHRGLLQTRIPFILQHTINVPTSFFQPGLRLLLSRQYEQ